MVEHDSTETQRLLVIFERLQVGEGTRGEMLAFYHQLSPPKQERVLRVLEAEDPDIARLIVATVPKMRAVLEGRGTSPRTFVQSVMTVLKNLTPHRDV
ncbi:hypothetical protein HY734_02395 [Candidatus Uhrbacteria bacterium]|nr:hypothetical protein [Candidatus Uhrbacteria bacterium]